PMSAAGGSPSQPVRHVPHHHAALRPSSHEYRQHARSRTGSHGQQAVSPGSTSISTATARLDLCSLESPSSHIEMVNLGRGPPRAGPRSDLTSPASQAALGSTAFPTHHPTHNRSRCAQGSAYEPSPPRPPGGRGGVFGLPSIGDS